MTRMGRALVAVTILSAVAGGGACTRKPAPDLQPAAAPPPSPPPPAPVVVRDAAPDVGETAHGLDLVVADLPHVHGSRLARARSASTPVSRLNATTPSTRSAATADKARPRTCTATTARNERVTLQVTQDDGKGAVTWRIARPRARGD